MCEPTDVVSIGGRQIVLAEIENILKEHPGVQGAMVTACTCESGDEKLVAYVTADADYLARAFAAAGDEGRRLNQWRTVYDWFGKSQTDEHREAGLNTRIWNSSYTRQPIAASEMREWVELAVEEILSLQPIEILEIGCGTGPLLLRFAARCARYIGTDFSRASLRSLQAQLVGDEYQNVRVLERAAHDFDGLRGDHFDTVVMNSVAQCFPSGDYLEKVLTEIIAVTKPGGHVFIGDVRNNALGAAFAVSVALYQAPATLSLAELRQQVRRRLQQERELVISPAYFLGVRRRHRQIAHVEIKPKLGEADNEMMKFRYDVVLRVGPDREPAPELSWLDWDTHAFTLEAVREELQEKRPDVLAITAVANARVEQDVAALARLRGPVGQATVGELREELRVAPIRGVHPRSLYSLGRESGYAVAVSWASSRSDGAYDVIFRKGEPGRETEFPPIVWPGPDTGRQPEPTKDLSDPSLLACRSELVQQLRDYLQSRLPEHQRPADLVLSDTLPLTTTGRPDRRGLPPPDRVLES